MHYDQKTTRALEKQGIIKINLAKIGEKGCLVKSANPPIYAIFQLSQSPNISYVRRLIMKTDERAGSFPVAGIKKSLIAAIVIFAVGGIIMKNQAFFCVKLASLAASSGSYEFAENLLGNIDTNNETEYFNQGLYKIATVMYERGDYKEASVKFAELGDYSDSSDMACRSKQQYADSLIDSGDYLQASSILNEIMFFDGSPELYNKCQYKYALEQISNGDWFAGAQILWSIKDYKDAEKIAKEAVYENTGSENVEETLGSGKPISPELLTEYLKLNEKREQLKDGSIAVGFFHTVGLKNDGSVIACGNNEYGQCDTGSWKNITQIAAGGYHTVGLRSDGTVVACGDNQYGQCNVKDWKDVIQIKATDYNTAALLKDGTVVVCGYNKLTKVGGWSGIDRICSGSYALCGINKRNELLFTHPSCKLDGDLLDADVSISYAIGLTVSGDVVFSSETPCEWGKASSVYAGGETVGIIDQEFKPSVYDRRHAKYYSLPDGNAVSMSLGGTHFAVLYDDGSVYCTGLNDDGQCDVANLNLN